MPAESESDSERAGFISTAEHVARPRLPRHRVPAALAGLLVAGAVAAACRLPWSGNHSGITAAPTTRGRTPQLYEEFFCGTGPWPEEKAAWCCEKKKINCGSEVMTLSPKRLEDLDDDFFCSSGPWPKEKARWCCENKNIKCESEVTTTPQVTATPKVTTTSTMRLEDMTREELVEIARDLEEMELGNERDLKVVEDPCLDMSKGKGHRLKAARLRRLKAKTKQDPLRRKAKTKQELESAVEELLQEEIDEVEDEEDPCKVQLRAANHSNHSHAKGKMPNHSKGSANVPIGATKSSNTTSSEKSSQARNSNNSNQSGSPTGFNGSKSSSGSSSTIGSHGSSGSGGSNGPSGPQGESTNAHMPANTTEKISEEVLNATHQHIKPAATAKCSATHEDCAKTRCCSDPGLQCYEKNKWWAACRAECIPNVSDPADVDPEPWSCKELGTRSPGKPVKQEHCHSVWTNCMNKTSKSRCCKDPGFACFTKNETFGKCMPECVPGVQYFDLDNNDPWDCQQASAAAPSTVGNWIQENCSGIVDDCRETRCCNTSGFMCYEMGEGWAQCKPNCTEGPPEDEQWEQGWTCKELGYETPPPPAELPNQPLGGKVGRWVKDQCSKPGEDCSDTSCCVSRATQCYRKNSTYATCALDCKKNSTWSCKELGTRSWGLAYVGFPSLFCFTLFRLESYEADLVRYQWKKRAGIFACDNFRVFSDKVTNIAGRETLKTPKVEVGVSKDGTAGNTELFMKVWDMVFEDGTLWDHDWTVKADPDAVLLSDRLRWRLEPHTNLWDHGGRLFVVNCNAWPNAGDFPMMYGSVEIFSQAAMRQYKERVKECKKDLPWREWGEDFFFTRCMDRIDVGRVEDFSLIGDNVCVGPGQAGAGECYDSGRAVFHPFKDIDAWEWCFKNAIR